MARRRPGCCEGHTPERRDDSDRPLPARHGNRDADRGGSLVLSIGVQPPDASWGTIIQDGQDLIYTRPAVSLAPGLAIALTVLALNVLGDGIRDALDPREGQGSPLMLRFVVRRMASALLVMFSLSVLVFLIFFATPGTDPQRGGWANADQRTLREVRKDFGLDKPMPVRYALMMKRLVVSAI